jgi:hypothetical protein
MRSRGGLVLIALAVAAAVDAQTPRPSDALSARVQALEDREAIRTLWAEYGRTLDARDFVAFSQLFARDGEFVGGPGSPARGPAAIGAFLEKGDRYELSELEGQELPPLFNESIEIQGDTGTGVSKGGFVMATGDNSKADFLLLATYRDQFVREDGKWKFKRREVIGEIPVPRARQ